MSSSTLLSAEELKVYILRRLGAPTVKVELDEARLEECIEDAVRWFSAKKGVKRYTYMDIYSGQTEYPLDEDIDTVLDVAFQVPPMDIGSVFAPFLLPDQQLPYNVFAAPESAGLYSNYTQTLSYVEQAKRVLGAEMEWRQEDRVLLIFPATKNQGKIRVEYKSHSFTLEQLNERDHDLVKRYALALAKRDLGIVRRKWVSGFPGAQGASQLDGQMLVQEADQEIEKLDEEISQSGFPLGFITG